MSLFFIYYYYLFLFITIIFFSISTYYYYLFMYFYFYFFFFFSYISFYIFPPKSLSHLGVSNSPPPHGAASSLGNIVIFVVASAVAPLADTAPVSAYFAGHWGRLQA